MSSSTSSLPGITSIDTEFQYGHPTSSFEQDIPVVTLPHPHPHDQTIFGARSYAPVPLLKSVNVAQQQQQQQPPVPQQSSCQALRTLITKATEEPKFRTVLFAPPPNALILPSSSGATSSSSSGAAATGTGSPPTSARASRSEKDATAAAAAAKKSAASSKGAKTKKVAEIPLTGEEQLIAATSQDLLMYIRESTLAHEQYTEWRKDCEIVDLPVAKTPLESVDTRFYTHLLNQVPHGAVTIPTMLHAMFEQVAATTTMGGSGGSSAQASAVSTTSTSGGSASLDDFFTNEALDDVDSFMNQALERVTFQAHQAQQQQQQQQNNRASLNSSSSTSALSRPSTSSSLTTIPLGRSPPVHPYLSFHDSSAIRRTECALALGLPLESDELSLEAESLLSEFIHIPGQQRDMPLRTTEEQEKYQLDQTRMVKHATENSNSGVSIKPEVFERALLLLELEEMLLQPAPEYKYTSSAALESKEETQVDVKIHDLNGKSDSSSSVTPSRTRSRLHTVSESRPGTSLYHTLHARRSNATVEAAIRAKMLELHTAAVQGATGGDNKASNSLIPKSTSTGFGRGFGFHDQDDSDEHRSDWKLEDRQWTEEFNMRTMPQVLMKAMMSASLNTKETQVRYRSLEDELLVSIHSSTPLTRQREATWSEYLTPNLEYELWCQCTPSIQKMNRNDVLWNWRAGSGSTTVNEHTGKLAVKTTSYYPCDSTLLTSILTQQDNDVHCVVVLEKDQTVIVWEKVKVPEMEIVEDDGSEEKKGDDLTADAEQSRPASRRESLSSGTTATTGKVQRGGLKKSPSSTSTSAAAAGGAGGQKKLSVSIAASAIKQPQGPPKSPTAGGTNAAGTNSSATGPSTVAFGTAVAPPSSSGGVMSKKKQQQEEARELEELTTLFREAQVELDQAREVESLEKALLIQKQLDEEKNNKEACVLTAKFEDDTRLSISGCRAPAAFTSNASSSASLLHTQQQSNSRLTFITRSGLMFELRSQDEVWMKYPRSVLEGDGKLKEKEEMRIVPPIGVVNANVNVGTVRKAKIPSSISSSTLPSNATLTSSLLPTLESYRIVSPQGIIYRVDYSGSNWLFLANGEVGYRASLQEKEWTWTGLDGRRTRNGKELDQINVAIQVDAESGAKVWTREDLTMYILYADGSSLAQHAEGSRIYVDVLKQKDSGSDETSNDITKLDPRQHVLIESPRFPPLEYTHSLRTDLRATAEEFAGGGKQTTSSKKKGGKTGSSSSSSGLRRASVIDLRVSFSSEGVLLTKSSRKDTVTFSRLTGERFLVQDSRVLYLPEGVAEEMAYLEDPSVDMPVQTYLFNLDLNQNGGNSGRHSTSVSSSSTRYTSFGGRLTSRDSEDNLFMLSLTSESHMILGRERMLSDVDDGKGGMMRDPIPASYYPLPSNQIEPRLFKIRRDGTGMELLTEKMMQKWKTLIRKDSRTRVLPLEECRYGVSHKYLTSLPHPEVYKRHPIIPNVIRAAPSALAAGSSLSLLAKNDPLVVLHGSKIAASPIQAQPVRVYRHFLGRPSLTKEDLLLASSLRQSYLDKKEAEERSETMHRENVIRSMIDGKDEVRRVEKEKMDEELRQTKDQIRARADEQVREVEEVASVDTIHPLGSRVGSARSSRPGTANSHRLPSSSSLLPKPVIHDAQEGKAIVEQMREQLEKPKKTFFQRRYEGVIKQRSENGGKGSRPSSASFIPSTQQEETPRFFSNSTFRRDYLLSDLLKKFDKLCTPKIGGGGADSASEKDDDTTSVADGIRPSSASLHKTHEDSWFTLTQQQRDSYQQQYTSQFTHLLQTSQQFLTHVSEFLKQPYNPALRQFDLGKEPYAALVKHGSQYFNVETKVIPLLTEILGFESQPSKEDGTSTEYVLTVTDEEYRETLQSVRSKFDELLSGKLEIDEKMKTKQKRQSVVVSAISSVVNDNSAITTRTTKSEPEESKESSSSPPISHSPNALSHEASSSHDFVSEIDYEGMLASLSAKERAAFTSTVEYQSYLSREQRLKQMKSSYSTQHHAAHNASFVYQSPFQPKEPHFPPQPARTTISSNPHPSQYDVTGAQRPKNAVVQLPNAMSASAASELNTRYLLNELHSGQPRPAPKTVSTVKQTWHNSMAPFASFTLQPSLLEMGVLRKGCTYRATLTLTNTGNMTGRFIVQQPESREQDLIHLKILYRPGLIAPGLQRRLEVEVYAGTVCEQLEETLVVKTEQHVFQLPLRARIVNDAEYARVKENGGAGIMENVVNTAASSTGTTQPQQPQVQQQPNTSYTHAYPTSSKNKKQGPFHLTSTFSQSTGTTNSATNSQATFAKTSGSIPAISKSPTLPRNSFGATGEIRMIQSGATPHIARALEKKQQSLARQAVSSASGGRGQQLQAQVEQQTI